MAKRRFLSLDIVNSDAFLEMPLSAQALYMHLILAADDDGFVGAPRRIQRFVGANEDDFKLLIAKRFLLTFDSGIAVIKHFKLQNTVKPDRYTPTVYQDELMLLRLKENRSYTELEKVEISTMVPECIQNGTRLEPQYSIDKISIDKSNRYIAQKMAQETFNDFWQAYPRKVSKKKAFESWLKICPDGELLALIIAAVELHKKSEQWQDERYIPHPSTWLNQRRWEDELTELRPANWKQLESLGIDWRGK